MIHSVFEWREDEEYGDYGWIMKNQPTFNVSNGLGVAHDTMEHFKSRHGHIAYEMRAFGAIMRVRVDGGFFCKSYNSDPAWHLSLDMAQILEKLDSDAEIAVAPRTYPLREGWIEEIIQTAITKGLKTANYDKEDEYLIKNGENTERMVNWMRIGYRQAVRRYPNSDGSDLMYCFEDIQRQVDGKYKNGEFGEELHIQINAQTLERRVSIKYPNLTIDCRS